MIAAMLVLPNRPTLLPLALIVIFKIVCPPPSKVATKGLADVPIGLHEA